MKYKELIKERLKDHPGRLEHVLGVNDEAIALAKRYDMDIDRGSIAAILHDIAKKMPLEEQKRYMQLGGYDTSHHPKTWHAYVGAYIAKHEFEIADDDILEAIEVHTTGRAGMSALSELIFIADYIERRTRDWDGVQKVREVAYQDLKKAVCMKLQDLMTEIESPHPDTVAAYQTYKEYCPFVK